MQFLLDYLANIYEHTNEPNNPPIVIIAILKLNKILHYNKPIFIDKSS